MTRPRGTRTATIAAALLAAIPAAVLIVSGSPSGGTVQPPATHRVVSAPSKTRLVAARTAVSRSGQGGQAPGGHYGGLPSWLPKATVSVDRVVTASAAHPRLGIEGDTIDVRLRGGRALTTVVGPAVPSSGHFPVPSTTPCTFTITLIVRSGRVRIDPRAFSILDEFGRRHAPSLSLGVGGRVPSTVGAGHTVVLSARAVLPTGSGQLRWSPVGGRPTASWDFAVEID